MSPGKAVCESRNGMTRYGAGSSLMPFKQKIPEAIRPWLPQAGHSEV